MPVPDAEVTIDAPLVQRLLDEQHPDLAALPLARATGGWDNELWRLGEELVVRLPRREAAVACTHHEQTWLVQLAPRLPVVVPAPIRLGVPGAGFPWPWSVVPWLPGTTADLEALGAAGVRDLGSALHALHIPAAAGAPRNPYRAMALAERRDPLDELDRLHDGTPPAALVRTWRRALAAPEVHVPRWTHGDLHARNLVVCGGDLAGVIDWGDLGAADPAVDLSVLWTVLEHGDHGVFCATYGAIEGALLARARGWALVFAVFFAGLDDDPGAVAIGRRTLARLLG